MNYKHILLSVLIPIVSAAYGQAPNEQRIQELKDAWLKKIQELETIGTKIIEKNKQVKDLQDDIGLVLSNYGEHGIDETTKGLYEKATTNFYERFFRAIYDDVNVKDFLTQELINRKGDFFVDKPDIHSAIDKIKMDLIQIIVECNIMRNLIRDYENRLQEIADIDHELVKFGQPRLFQD
jgi:hypothetical protein